MKILLVILSIILVAIPAYSQEVLKPQYESEWGEIIRMDLWPEPIFTGETLTVKALVKNTSRKMWTAGDYVLLIKLFDESRKLVLKSETSIVQMSIPAGTEEIIEGRIRVHKAGKFYIQGFIILKERITGLQEERIEGPYIAFVVQERKLRAKLSGSFSSYIENIEIKGNETGPFVTKGTNYVEDLNLRLRVEPDQKTVAEGYIHSRATDDPLVDCRNFSIEEGYAQVIGEILGIRAGDFYADFSDYSLSQSLTGIRAVLRTRDFQMIQLFGRIWEEENFTRYARYVRGFRIEKTMRPDKKTFILPRFEAGVNYAHTEDSKRSLRYSEFSNGIADINNLVCSFDTKFTLLPGLKVETEYAKSKTHHDMHNYLPPDEGTAFKIKSRYKLKGLRLSGGYERVDDRFKTSAGFARVDNKEYFLKGEYRVNPRLKLISEFKRYHDNVKRRSDNTKITNRVKNTISFNPFSSWKYFRVNLSYKELFRDDTSNTLDEKDKITDMLISHRFKNVRMTFGQKHRKEEDYISHSNDKITDTTSIGAKVIFNFLGMELAPYLRYSYEQGKNVVVNRKDITQNSSLGFNYKLFEIFDATYRYTIMDRDRYEYLNDAVKVSQELNLAYRIGGSYDKMITLIAKNINYNHEKDSLDYLEKLYGAKIELRF